MRIAVLAVLVVVLATGCRSGVVSYVVDGDTVDVGGTRIRVLGIDTPERGRCGYRQAKDRMAQLVLNQ